MYLIKNICEIVSGRFILFTNDGKVSDLSYDSRKIQAVNRTLFFALRTAHADGHQFLEQAWQKGVRNFIVAQEVDTTLFADSNIILVENTLLALQQLAAFHRRQFSIPVIGITGSNGKTIVKEWLYQLLNDDFNIVRSPRSYNSQLGVSLSVWQMNSQHTLAIFEAGISEAGEMKKLEQIIKPTIGVLTNIGEAHDAGFDSAEQKKYEKLLLFENPDVVIGPYHLLEKGSFKKTFTWGSLPESKLQLLTIERSITNPQHTVVFGKLDHEKITIHIPFSDEASIQNAISCVCVLVYLRYDIETINQRLTRLHAIDMRLHFMQGINNCAIINDSYSADITSFHIALAFLQQQNTGQQRKVILSDFIETGKSEEELYDTIATDLKQNRVGEVIAIGEKISAFLPQYLDPRINIQTYPDTDVFIKNFRSSLFQNETILIKGARKFEFERIAKLFEQKVHQTHLEINLNAIAHNLKEYRKLLRKDTLIMAMVKAFAYGSGGAEIASILQFNNVSYLGVAYVDEGVELRKAGITLPIMVMNADESSFNAIIDYNLEPVIYSFQLLYRFDDHIKGQGLPAYPVHIEIETGMNRLGFPIDKIDDLGGYLNQSQLKIVSVFSHLASSEDASQDEFTVRQYNHFQEAVANLKKYITYPFLKHIANSAAIVRHPQMQMNMVRLGIGLYGVEIETHSLQLQPVATLRSTIAQIKKLKAGDTVSYNRRGIIKADATIATVRIGYADGYSRRYSNGVGKFWVKGKLVPVVGTVCMDMTMIDVTGIANVKEEDEVIVFGRELPVQKMASWIDSIPYEIMTSISQRVKRIYFQE